MRRFILIILASLVVAWEVDAGHSVPRGSNTFYLGVSGFEHDPELFEYHAARQCWEEQGYQTGVEHQFHNMVGYAETWTLLTIDDFVGYVKVESDPIAILQTYQHANPVALAIELYSHTDPRGRDTRDDRFERLDNVYTAGVEIVKMERTGSNPFYGIGITERFFKTVFSSEPSVRGPDLYVIVGSNTANASWESLLEDNHVGLRCLVTLDDSLHVDFDTMIPWNRMNCRTWGGLEGGSKRLRTAPLAFLEPEWIVDRYYLMNQSGQPLFDVDLATGVDSLGLSPTVLSTTLQAGRHYDQFPVYEQIRFSCRMNKNVPEATLSGLGGAYLWNEEWTDDYTLRFRVESVRNDPWSSIRLNAMRDGVAMTRSADGNHAPTWSGTGPVSDSLLVVNCTYEDPNYACAYDPVFAWRDGLATRVWLMGTEVGTTAHRILGGATPETMQEVATVPGSGIEYFVIDALVDVPRSDINYVQVIEEPDGSSTRIIEVQDSEPDHHIGHDHVSGVVPFTPTILSTYDEPLLESEGCPDWVFYGPSDLLADLHNYQNIYDILNDLGYSQFADLEYPYENRLVDYLRDCKATYGTLPKGVTILGSGCDLDDHPDNIMPPFKWDGCEDCSWTSWQSGDAAYGALAWHDGGEFFPEVAITRIPVRNASELFAYGQNAKEYHLMAMDGTLPRRSLVLLGDELEGDVQPDSSVSIYENNIIPSLAGDGWSVQTMADSDYSDDTDGYLQSHLDFAAIRNELSSWCSYMTSIGPVSNVLRTPGYLVHKGEGSHSWDGTLFTPNVFRPFGMFAPGCGSAGVFRNTTYRPTLAEDFNDQFVYWVGCTSGGLESFHREWMELWNYFMPLTENTFECYRSTIQTFSIRQPERFEYAMGMEYLGIPMHWQDRAVEVPQVHGESTTHLLRCTSPFSDRTILTFQVPKSGLEVAVNVYDVQGRRVATPYRGKDTYAEIVWDGRGDYGPLAAGIYFATLEVGRTRMSSVRLVRVK